jgi:hypothetical protein
MFWGLFKKKSKVNDEEMNSIPREKEVLSIEEEIEIKKIFNSSVEPKLWVAKFGHTIYCGDFRNSIFPDKEFQKWIYEVFDLLHAGKTEELRNELLTEEEINEIKDEAKYY